MNIDRLGIAVGGVDILSLFVQGITLNALVSEGGQV